MENNNQVISNYDKTMHTHGRIWTLIMLSAIMSVPFVICLIFNVKPNFKIFMNSGVIVFILMYIPACLVEVFTYSGMLGTGGTYLAFVTGNLSNLKIPCAVNARDLAGVKVGTKENEIISTLAVASSSIVTTVTIIIGVVLLIPLTPVLKNPILAPGFECVVFALFGAMGYKYVKENPKIAVVPLAVMILLGALIPSLATQVAILVIIGAGIAIAIGLTLLKKNKI